MANEMLGMAPGQAEEYARQISADAQRVRDLLGAVGRLVADVAWFGADGDRFRTDWQANLGPRLIAVTTELDRTADELNRHAAAQRHVSGN